MTKDVMRYSFYVDEDKRGHYVEDQEDPGGGWVKYEDYRRMSEQWEEACKKMSADKPVRVDAELVASLENLMADERGDISLHAKELLQELRERLGATSEPTGDRYVGEPEHIPAPVSGGTSTITGYDLGTRSMRIEPRGKPFCAHKRLLSRDNSDGGRITEATIQCSECGEWIQFRGMGGGVNRGAESK